MRVFLSDANVRCPGFFIRTCVGGFNVVRAIPLCSVTTQRGKTA